MNINIVFPTELTLNFMSLQQQEAVFSKKKPMWTFSNPSSDYEIQIFFSGVGGDKAELKGELILDLSGGLKIHVNVAPCLLDV